MARGSMTPANGPNGVPVAPSEKGWREGGERSPPGNLRLFAPALLIWMIAATAVGIPGGGWAVLGAAALWGLVLLALATGVFGATARRGVGPLLRLGAVCGAASILLGCSLVVGQQQRSDPQLAQAVASAQDHTLKASLRGFVQHRAASAAPVAASDTTSNQGANAGWILAELDAPGAGTPVVLWLDQAGVATCLALGPGNQIELRGTGVPLDSGSSAAYGIRVSEVTVPAQRGGVIARAAHLAAALRSGLRAAAMQVPGAELVPGFAVGDTSLVSEKLQAQMESASTVHVTAVSGANIAMTVACVVWLASRCGVGRRLRICMAGLALGGFVILVGPDPSVQRAAIMASVMLVADFGGQQARSLPALGLAMLIMLLGDPWQARQAGFALSVAATAGILLLAPLLERGVVAHWPFQHAPPRWLVLPPTVAFSAQLACGPFLLLVQGGLPVAGVLANSLIQIAAPLGTGLGLLALLLLPLAEPIGQFCVVLASYPARWVAATSEVAAQLPGARFAWPGGWPGAALLAATEAALLSAWLLATRRIRIPRGRRADGDFGSSELSPWTGRPALLRTARLAVVVLLCLAAGILVGPTAVAPGIVRGGTPARWDVVACDVGQGDALLLRDSRHPDIVMLVDTGDEAELLDACLSRFGVKRIALLVLTHDDRDHVGALDAVTGRADAVLVAPANQHDGPERPLLHRLDAAELPVTVGAAGMSGVLAEGLEWEVLAPAELAHPADTNAASLVLRVQLSGVAILLLADTGAQQQLVLRSVSENLQADLVKIAHHGSKDQDAALPGIIGAKLGIISVGADNGYGHPAAATVESYRRAGTLVLRTDLHGSIALSVPDPDVDEAGEASELIARAGIWLERSPQQEGAPAETTPVRTAAAETAPTETTDERGTARARWTLQRPASHVRNPPARRPRTHAAPRQPALLHRVRHTPPAAECAQEARRPRRRWLGPRGSWQRRR